jgi:hypothetical protein
MWVGVWTSKSLSRQRKWGNWIQRCINKHGRNTTSVKLLISENIWSICSHDPIMVLCLGCSSTHIWHTKSMTMPPQCPSAPRTAGWIMVLCSGRGSTHQEPENRTRMPPCSQTDGPWQSHVKQLLISRYSYMIYQTQEYTVIPNKPSYNVMLESPI